MKKTMAIILPSLDPDYKFAGVVQGLAEAGFEHIIIVDDGSDEAHQHWFAQAEEYSACTVLHHGVNKGKGRALKTAFSYVREHLPQVEGVITIDGDGQHLLPDIISCGERMLAESDKVVMGCRDFDLPGVPPRSVAGNKTVVQIKVKKGGRRARRHIAYRLGIDAERRTQQKLQHIKQSCVQQKGAHRAEHIADRLFCFLHAQPRLNSPLNMIRKIRQESFTAL